MRIGNQVIIEDGILITEGATIAERAVIGRHVTFCDADRGPDRAQLTQVKEGARIGANATVQCGVTVGRYAQIGPGSVVTHDVPDFGYVAGNSAKQQGWCVAVGGGSNCP